MLDISMITNAVSAALGAGVTYGIMCNKLANHGIRIKDVEGKFDSHEKSPLPHLLCPAHEASMTAITATLGEIKGQLSTIGGQIFILTSRQRD